MKKGVKKKDKKVLKKKKVLDKKTVKKVSKKIKEKIVKSKVDKKGVRKIVKKGGKGKVKGSYRKLIIVGVVLFLLMILSGGLTGYFIKDFLGFGNAGSGSMSNVIVTRANLPMFLQSTNLVQELPKSSEIGLKLFNSVNGEREWEETYVVKKGQVVLGTPVDPDIVAFIDSKYIGDLNNFCNTIQVARNNGEFGFDKMKNDASLLWKFKGMTKYKNCFGF